MLSSFGLGHEISAVMIALQVLRRSLMKAKEVNIVKRGKHGC